MHINVESLIGISFLQKGAFERYALLLFWLSMSGVYEDFSPRRPELVLQTELEIFILEQEKYRNKLHVIKTSNENTLSILQSLEET